MFAMQSKELHRVFVDQVLGVTLVFVQNLVTLLVNARSTRSFEDSSRLFPKCTMLFWTRVKGRLR